MGITEASDALHAAIDEEHTARGDAEADAEALRQAEKDEKHQEEMLKKAEGEEKKAKDEKAALTKPRQTTHRQLRRLRRLKQMPMRPTRRPRGMLPPPRKLRLRQMPRTTKQPQQLRMPRARRTVPLPMHSPRWRRPPLISSLLRKCANLQMYVGSCGCSAGARSDLERAA